MVLPHQNNRSACVYAETAVGSQVLDCADLNGLCERMLELQLTLLENLGTNC